MEVREFLLRGDGSVLFAGDVDHSFTVQVRDREDALGIDVGDERIGAFGSGEKFVPVRQIPAVEHRLPLSPGRRELGGAHRDSEYRARQRGENWTWTRFHTCGFADRSDDEK
jgi:hypothetical protein